MRSYGPRSKFMVHDFKKIYGLIHLIIPGTRLLTVSISWSIAPLNYGIHLGSLPFFISFMGIFKKIPSPYITLSCACICENAKKHIYLHVKINNEYA